MSETPHNLRPHPKPSLKAIEALESLELQTNMDNDSSVNNESSTNTSTPQHYDHDQDKNTPETTNQVSESDTDSIPEQEPLSTQHKQPLSQVIQNESVQPEWLTQILGNIQSIQGNMENMYTNLTIKITEQYQEIKKEINCFKQELMEQNKNIQINTQKIE